MAELGPDKIPRRKFWLGRYYSGPQPFYRITATALGASMWFFLMYRAKKDGPVLLGWKHPWDH